MQHIFKAALLTTTLLATSAGATLIGDLGGPAGYGELALNRNDDSSSSALNLPFNINYFGNTYSQFFINNNGNITFNSSLSTFTPEAFPLRNGFGFNDSIFNGNDDVFFDDDRPVTIGNTIPIIAPFWSDVDTSCGACGEVYVASPNEQTVVVTWDNVGYFDSNADKTNTFQMALIDRSDTGEGNFDVNFNYGNLEWTTGDASGGDGGLGGSPAQAGYDAGDGVNFFTLPGSGTSDILDLQNTSNTGEAGEWTFAIRDGELPGNTAENPILPVEVEGSWTFDFNIIDEDKFVFIDPEVAIGYTYEVNSGPNFQSVLLPDIGDGIYDLFTFDTALNDYIDTTIDLFAATAYDFGAGGLDNFQIRGIETSAMLDPNDFTAFVTGLTFTAAGPINLSQTPLTVNIAAPGAGGTTAVSEPGMLGLMLAGLGLMLGRRYFS